MAFLILRPRDLGRRRRRRRRRCFAPTVACCDFYRAINATVVHVLRQRSRLVDRSPTIKNEPEESGDLVQPRVPPPPAPSTSPLPPSSIVHLDLDLIIPALSIILPSSIGRRATCENLVKREGGGGEGKSQQKKQHSFAETFRVQPL